MSDATPVDTAAAFRRARSEAWLRDFAQQSEMTYEQLLECFEDCAMGRAGSVHFGGDAANTPTDILRVHAGEFWLHYETVTGTEVPNKDDITFRCGC